MLRQILPHHAETKGKFSPNWRGTFVVKRVLPNGALYLADIEGKVIETVVNVDAVKRYYIRLSFEIKKPLCLGLTFQGLIQRDLLVMVFR